MTALAMEHDVQGKPEDLGAFAVHLLKTVQLLRTVASR
jgi:hypothetical protein